MRKMLPLIENPQHICILRLSALGDATHVVPVVNAIRAHWPECKISWVIGKIELKLLDQLKGVEFIPFDKRGGLAAALDLRHRLKGRKFDVLLHMQVAARANIISRLIKAPIRLGWDRMRSRDRHHWFINHTIRQVPMQHQVPGFLEFAWALGIPESSPQWNLPVSPESRSWANKLLADLAPILMISPCSSHSLRNWRIENYAALADHASQNLGMQPVLIGGPGDQDRRTGVQIQELASSRIINLIGKDTLAQSMALMEKASVLVSPDSGPAHIASALGIPVIGLYAATWSRRSGPFNSLQHCVDQFPEAARRYRGKEPQHLRWGTRIEVPGVMDLVKLDSVIEKLEQIQADSPGQGMQKES